MTEENAVFISCPKCDYTRSSADDAHTPSHTCPQCGVVYAKAKKPEDTIHHAPRSKANQVTLQYELASLPQRALGQFLDSLVAFLPILIGALFHVGILVILGLGYLTFYYFLADGFEGGRSYGKKMVGTCVVDKNTGEPCSYLQSFIRNLLLAVLSIIDWVFIFGKGRQRLGDIVANTIVIKGDGVRFISGK